MSYDWSIEVQAKDVNCPHCGGHIAVEEAHSFAYWNPTYNYGPMFRAATETPGGIHDFDGKQVVEVLPLVETMYERMVADPAKFRALEPSNKWGTYDEWIPFMRDTILPAFRNAPADAIVRVR